MLPDIDLKHKCNNINKLKILVLVVQSWLVADKLYELMKWKLTKINECKQVKNSNSKNCPNFKLQREFRHKKRKIELCLSLTIYP